MSRIYIGTCSWADHAPFYPPDLPANQQISYYAQRFPLVEVNASYYRLMPARNYALWAERTPPHFVFDVKAFQQLTYHDRQQPPTREAAVQFCNSVQPLREAGKLGALHFQFPPWFAHSERNLEYIRHLRAFYADDPLSVEFRHRSWDDGDAYPATVAALREAGVGLTVVDEPQIGAGSVPTRLDVTTPGLCIVRLHGRNSATWYKRVKTTAERFDYCYSAEELRAWAPHVAHLAELAETVHVLFNNNAEDYAIQNARQLRLILRETPVGAAVVASPEE